MKNKKGLSTVVTTVILIALVVVAVGLIWFTINNLIKDRLDKAESCSDIFDKITLNKVYTCWQNDSEQNYAGKTQVSINVEDIEVDQILVSISSAGNSKGFELIDQQSYVFLKEAGASSGPISLVNRYQGKTYIVDTSHGYFGFDQAPEVVKISPTVGGEQCGIVDTATEVEACGSGITLS